MPIDLYYFRVSAPSRAILMTVRHLQINVNLKHIDLTEGQQHSEEFLKINPTHQVPVLIDNGFTLWESRAIMQYLCNEYAPNSSLYPTEPKARALVDRWLNFDSELYSTIDKLQIDKSVKGVEIPEDVITNYKNRLKVLDKLIGVKLYLTGDQLTIADLSLLATTTYIAWSEEFDFNDYPNYKRWNTRLKSELPYYEDINGITREDRDATLAKLKARFQSFRMI
ncbi:unnamed protein product [Oppiella nova]|uniref:Glutathione S-transferase n=1 Tax=Oppiella nova TaxID=334625 RepID=A0A7R9LZU0_9ACAR|nr:unnamed protein product [Oppiella nova]CAG2168545.1 unnamed protein product [Oppiella nova]